MRFVLASASPARLATLRAAGVEPEVIVSGVDETSIRATSVSALVRTLAEVKARAVAARIDDGLVLGCDSLLELDVVGLTGVGLGKPVDAAQAIERWQRMSGRSGDLHTGHALLRVVAGEVETAATQTATTTVHFADLTPDEIAGYVATAEPLAVAGGFTIDGLGGWFVEAIEGDHHNVVGLSLPLLRRMLGGMGLSLTELGYGAALDSG